jgi:hypothetical protein
MRWSRACGISISSGVSADGPNCAGAHGQYRTRAMALATLGCGIMLPAKMRGLGLSILWLTIEEVSHAKAHIGCEDQSDDCA